MDGQKRFELDIEMASLAVGQSWLRDSREVSGGLDAMHCLGGAGLDPSLAHPQVAFL